MKKYLVTYGNDSFATQRAFLKKTALAAGFFDEIRIFTPIDIDAGFRAQVEGRLDLKRGGGYWLWKPYLLKTVFDEMERNDVLVYCDAGSMINPDGRQRFEEYLDLLAASKTGTIDFELPHKEYEYTYRALFDFFKSSEDMINSNQLMATVLLFRKCARTMKLIDTWYDLACNKSFLFTDELHIFPQHIDFIDHRHDQSVFSLLRKKMGATIIPDETWFVDFLKEGKGFPFWATRLPK